MRIGNFSTIRICAKDVSKSRDWYSRFFGMQPMEDSNKFVSFKVGETFFDICEADEKSPYSFGGSIGYWLVENLDMAIEHAVSLGGEVYRGPLHVKEAKRTIAQIKDPNGNVFGLEEINR